MAFTADDYIRICQQLSERHTWRAQLRTSLRQRMRQSDLMNGPQMAGSLEAIYLDLAQARQSALLKRHGYPVNVGAE